MDVRTSSERFRALHYAGGGGACGWFAVEPLTGRLMLYREYVSPGLDGPQAFGRAIASRGADDERYTYTVANDEVFAGHEGAPRTCDVLAQVGIYCDTAKGDPESRANRMLDYQAKSELLLPDGSVAVTAGLVTLPACIHARRVLPGAGRDSTEPVALMVLYAVMSRPTHELRRVDPAVARGEAAERAQKARERAKEGNRRR